MQEKNKQMISRINQLKIMNMKQVHFYMVNCNVEYWHHLWSILKQQGFTFRVIYQIPNHKGQFLGWLKIDLAIKFVQSYQNLRLMNQPFQISLSILSLELNQKSYEIIERQIFSTIEFRVLTNFKITQKMFFEKFNTLHFIHIIRKYEGIFSIKLSKQEAKKFILLCFSNRMPLNSYIKIYYRYTYENGWFGFSYQKMQKHINDSSNNPVINVVCCKRDTTRWQIYQKFQKYKLIQSVSMYKIGSFEVKFASKSNALKFCQLVFYPPTRQFQHINYKKIFIRTGRADDRTCDWFYQNHYALQNKQIYQQQKLLKQYLNREHITYELDLNQMQQQDQQQAQNKHKNADQQEQTIKQVSLQSKQQIKNVLNSLSFDKYMQRIKEDYYYNTDGIYIYLISFASSLQKSKKLLSNIFDQKLKYISCSNPLQLQYKMQIFCYSIYLKSGDLYTFIKKSKQFKEQQCIFTVKQQQQHIDQLHNNVCQIFQQQQIKLKQLEQIRKEQIKQQQKQQLINTKEKQMNKIQEYNIIKLNLKRKITYSNIILSYLNKIQQEDKQFKIYFTFENTNTVITINNVIQYISNNNILNGEILNDIVIQQTTKANIFALRSPLNIMKQIFVNYNTKSEQDKQNRERDLELEENQNGRYNLFDLKKIQQCSRA